jgi:hypothetical protein
VKHGVYLFHGAIDRAGREIWRKRYGFSESAQSDEEAAFDECLRNVDGFVHTHMRQERIIWIADRSGYEKSVKHGLQFFQWISAIPNDRLQEFFKLIPGSKVDKDAGVLAAELRSAPRPSHVIDTIYFGDSHESLALQLADVCCSTVTEHLLGNADAAPFYNLLRRQLVTDGSVTLYSSKWQGNR